MGLFDDVDFDEPHDFDNGFDPSVCDGCEHHETDGKMNSCGLCGCPTSAAGPMNLLGAPPESCPYLPEHAEKSEEDDGGIL
jgi:hypothetical protein